MADLDLVLCPLSFHEGQTQPKGFSGESPSSTVWSGLGHSGRGHRMESTRCHWVGKNQQPEPQEMDRSPSQCGVFLRLASGLVTTEAWNLRSLTICFLDT